LETGATGNETVGGGVFFPQRRNNERRKKTKVLTLNKYTAMGPRRLDARSDRAGWLPAVSYCPALLCTDTQIGETPKQIEDRGEIEERTQRRGTKKRDRREITEQITEDRSKDCSETQRQRVITHCKRKIIVTTSGVVYKQV
jgi:hypothetical protein